LIASFEPSPRPSTRVNLLLRLCLLTLRSRSIALAETFATSAIAPLDEAGSQVVAPAVAADVLLRFRFSVRRHLRPFCLSFFPGCSLTDLLGLRSHGIRLTTLRRRRGAFWLTLRPCFRLSISTHPFAVFLLSHIGSHGMFALCGE
jgi:hypothetical protein